MSDQVVAKGVSSAATRARGRLDLSDKTYKVLFLLPAVIIILVLSVFPMFFSLAIAFSDWHLFRQEPVAFAGLTNWARLMGDKGFWLTVRNSAMYVAFIVPVQYVIGLTLAMCLNEGIRGQKFFRTYFIIPIMISPVAVGMIIGKMLLNESVGPLNDVVMRLGGERVMWLSDPFLAFISLILVEVWHWTPFLTLVLLAALQSLPQEPYEASKVDGASRLQAFRFITFPLILPVSLTMILIRSLEVFKLMDIIKVVTGGGPGQATESVTLLVYDLGVKGGEVSYAAAASYALLIMAVVFGMLFLTGARRLLRDVT